MNEKRLYRMRKPSAMVTGVCSGIAAYFNWNPTKVRIAYVGTFIIIARVLNPYTNISFTIFEGLIYSLIGYLILTFFIPLHPLKEEKENE